MDPIDSVLEDLGRMRGKAYTEMVRLPAPDPFKKVLQEVDTILSKTETEIRHSRARLSIHRIAERFAKGG